MSLNKPPEALRYEIDGGAGSLLVIIIFSNFPILLDFKSFLIEKWPGSYRLLKPNCILGLNFLIFLKVFIILLMFKSKGFSQKIVFLNFIPSYMNLICVFVGLDIKIISTSLSVNISV